VALVLCSSLLTALALPNELTPWGSPTAGLVCVAPFFAAVVLAARPRRAASLGALFGAVSSLLSNFWLMFFQEFTFWTLGGVVLAYTGFCALLGAVLHGLAHVGRAAYRPFLLAAGWTVYEYLKSTGFLGYPWALLAHPVHSVLPLIQIADIAGVWGVSLLVALANALVAEGMLRASGHTPPPGARGLGLRQTAVAALLVAAAVGYGAFRLAEPDPGGEQARELAILLVQPNGDPWRPFDAEVIATNQALSEEGVRAARGAGGRPDLVVWSETSLPRDPSTYREQYRRYPQSAPLLPYLERLGIPHLSGSAVELGTKTQDYMNGAVLVMPDGSVVETYGKQHPVPFAEAIPFWENPVVRRFFTEAVGIQYPWTMGTRSVVFQTTLGTGETARFGVPICFEDAFGDINRRFVRDGADLLINLTNDSWSRTVSALTQHFVAAKFRSVETRRPLARSTNGGITAVVDTKGKVTAMLPWFEPGYLNATIRLPAHPRITTYARYGDWLPLVLAAVLVGYLGGVVALERWSRRRSTRRVPRARATP
jgi:apolipoprotein N-acyltransferase